MTDLKFEGLKDEILKFAIEKAKNATVLTTKLVSIDELHKKYEPLYNSDIFDRAIEEIIAYEPRIVEPNKSKEGRFSANSFTKAFLDQGGFKKLHHDKIVEKRKESKKREFDFQISRFQTKTKLLPHIVSIVSLIIAIISLCYSL